MGCINSDNKYKKSTLNKNIIDALSEKSLLKEIVFKQKIIYEIIERIHENKNIDKIQRIFAAKANKYRAQEFHNCCNNKQQTLLLAVTKNQQYFGAYSPCKWLQNQMYAYQQDKKCLSFIFKILKQNGQVKFYHLIPQKSTFAIQNNQQSGPIFGDGHDIYISDQPNINPCWCLIGSSYNSQNRIMKGSTQSYMQLTGHKTFLLKQYQIWSLF